MRKEMRLRIALAAGGLAVLALTVAPAASSNAVPFGAAIDPLTTPIKHVVIIYQENHTFDEVLGKVCQTRPTPCNAFNRHNVRTAAPYVESQPVTLHDGKTVPNIVEPDIVPSVKHLPGAQDLAMRNKWDRIGGCTANASPTYRCIAHVRRRNMPNLVALATNYAVSDQTFAAEDTASFGAHIDLAAGSIDGFFGDNPVASKSGVSPKQGWGCRSNKDALWGASKVYVPSCVPNRNGAGPYWNNLVGHSPSPVPYLPTIMQSMETAGLSWHMYQGHLTTAPTNNDSWSICSYFWWCTAKRNKLAYNSSYASLKTDAANGTLPSLALVTPVARNSQHNSDSMATGDNYIGSIVSAVQSSPQWSSTAVFITYDDCGCFYDHVKPPAGYGLRNPMVIVSPWVKPSYTDSTQAVQPYSMLSFIDHNFGLPDLSSQVANAYDYANSFDFTKATPASPTVTMTHTHISKATKRQVARYIRLHPDPAT